MRQNISIAVLILSIVVLGLWGQAVRVPDLLTSGFADRLFEVFMLFGLESDWTRGEELPWQLQVARFLAPLALLFSVIFVIVDDSWIMMRNFFVRYWTGHVVVAGLGPRGWQFVQSCESQHDVVILESNPENPLIERARAEGWSVITADALDNRSFAMVNLRFAKDLVAFMGDDGKNVELTLKAREYVRESHPPNHHMRIHLHVDDSLLAYHLEEYPKFFAEYSLASINFFSVYDLSARMLLKYYPPDRDADLFGHDRVHIALYQFGRLANEILNEAVRICHYANGSRLRFTIFDSDAEFKEEALKQERPGLERICDFEFVSVGDLGPHIVHQLSTEFLQSVTQHVICENVDKDSLILALILRAELLQHPGCNAPIMVRMQESSGLAQLLESSTGEPEIPDGLYPFGMFNEVLSIENIIKDELNELAKTYHEDYLGSFSREVLDRSIDPSHRAWELLSEKTRKSNLLKGDHIDVKSRAIGCDIRDTPLDKGFSLTDEEAATLARMEKERWNAERYFDGWEYGQVKNSAAKKNPLLVPWEELSPDQQKSEIEQARRLPAGIHFARRIVIGVTGHRNHKLDVTDPKLIADVDKLLRHLRAVYAKRKILVMSPLAEGADRLVAIMAQRILGAGLIVPLPLPFEEYINDFTSQESIEEFKVLVGQAERYFELPMKFGNLEELTLDPDGSVNEKRNEQYALAGGFIAERSDELIAVWDGEPADGTGGCAQIVEWRRAGKVPAPYSSPSSFFRPPAMKAPLVIDVGSGAPTTEAPLAVA